MDASDPLGNAAHQDEKDRTALPLEETAIQADRTLGEAAPVAAELGQNTEAGAPIHRVIDVPLTVTLRFGQRQLTLRELLELNTGSLVELDQQVEEPVHLMLGERVIAKGEVVIVDGNYGMRVLEVIESTHLHRAKFASLQDGK